LRIGHSGHDLTQLSRVECRPFTRSQRAHVHLSHLSPFCPNATFAETAEQALAAAGAKSSRLGV